MLVGVDVGRARPICERGGWPGEQKIVLRTTSYLSVQHPLTRHGASASASASACARARTWRINVVVERTFTPVPRPEKSPTEALAANP